MLVLDVTLNIFSLAAIFIAGLLMSSIFFGRKIRSLKGKVTDLEKEMLSNHAEILQLHREKVQLLEKIQEAPIVPPTPAKTAEDLSLEKSSPKVRP